MAAIHYAAKGGHLECVKFFLKQGTNPNLPGESR
jgi:ankyrin repeat protein